MGNGRFDNNVYTHNVAQRRATGRKTMEYTETATKIHPSLDPKRIPNKPFSLLESRDSAEHPMSLAIVLAFDVTGSNIRNAEIAQQKLPELMGKLLERVTDPQIAIWSNDDARSSTTSHNAIQMSDFESDNRIDDSIRSLWLTSNGGGNGGESYDLILYAAARKTVTDCWDKRGRKGYLFLYADERFFEEVSIDDVNRIFGDCIEVDVPIESMIAEVKERWNIKILWPSTGYRNAREQYVRLFGEECVETLESPNDLCEKVATIVTASEAALPAVAVADHDPDFFSRTE